MEMSRISTYKCYARWDNGYLICLCKIGNPACDRFNTCETEEFEHKQYEDITKCMQHVKSKE